MSKNCFKPVVLHYNCNSCWKFGHFSNLFIVKTDSIPGCLAVCLFWKTHNNLCICIFYRSNIYCCWGLVNDYKSFPIRTHFCNTVADHFNRFLHNISTCCRGINFFQKVMGFFKYGNVSKF